MLYFNNIEFLILKKMVFNILSKKVNFVLSIIYLVYCLPKVTQFPTLKEEEGMTTSVYGEELNSDADNNSEGIVYFVLEENSGYMEPSLNFLAVAHTIISFCCIIGYYCLKVYQFKNFFHFI